MKTNVICKTTSKGRQSYFVKVGGKQYYLFEQAYRKSNREFFKDGVCIDAIGNFAKAHSKSVRRTLDKLPAYLRYVEKECRITIFNKSDKKPYNRNIAKRQKSYMEDIVNEVL